MLTRSEIPVSTFEHRYQVGFLLFEFDRDNPINAFLPSNQIIIWRTVTSSRFLRKYSKRVLIRAAAADVMAVFHAGDVQRFGRQCFRALPA
jgi:hypothetical protein